MLVHSFFIIVITTKGFPGSSTGKESTCNAGDPSSIPGSRKSPGERISYPLQYSWAYLVAQMVKNLLQRRWLDLIPGLERPPPPTPPEESMATRSTILAWRIPIDREAWYATVHRVTESDITKTSWKKNRFIILQFYRSEVQHGFPWAKTEVSGSLRKNLPFSACRGY